MLELTFSAFPCLEFAFYHISCNLPLQLQVLPQHSQLEIQIKVIITHRERFSNVFVNYCNNF